MIVVNSLIKCIFAINTIEYMERFVLNQLIEWKESEGRKPLVLLGARQVGKTYILKEFGKSYYENVAYINCDNNESISNVFEGDFQTDRIIMLLSALSGQKILPKKTLIILDEIQEAPRGLSSLKYFYEDATEYHIIVAGSLLGVSLHHQTSFPVGKVNILHMYPMTFEEFLLAKGKEHLLNLLRTGDWTLINAISAEYIQLLREYYVIGGMPEVVKTFIQHNDIISVRKIQKEILEAYSRDMSKHVSKSGDVIRISEVWQSIPAQLAKENTKFIYGLIRQGARAKEYETAIQWLIDAGLLHKVTRVKKPEIPLKMYEEQSFFKLFLLDVGLLGAMAEIPISQLLIKNEGMKMKGYLTENYVCTQLKTLDIPIHYYSKDNSQLEIDFIVQDEEKVVAIEVKAEENIHSKSLSSLIKDYPNLRGLRYSMREYRDQEWMENVPLYACSSYFINKLKSNNKHTNKYNSPKTS